MLMSNRMDRETCSAAEEKAWQDLAHMDAKSIAKNSLAEHDRGEFRLKVLGSEVTVSILKGTVTSTGEHDRALDLLALHYLIGCRAGGPSGELILFRQMRGGEAYNDAFQRRVLERIAAEFGDDPAALIRAGKALDGVIRSKGNASVELPLFPKVRVTVIVWKGDGEVPPSANMLFDRSVGEILPAEDVAIAGSIILDMLVREKETTDGTFSTDP